MDIVSRMDGLKNLVSGFGTSRSRAAGTRVTARLFLKLQELDSLEQKSLLRKLAGAIVDDSITTIKIEGIEDGLDATLAELQRLAALAVFSEAGAKARHYGGAAIWIVCDGGGEDISKPLDLETVERVNRLVVMDRFELSRQGSGDLDTDPRSPTFLQPTVYLYSPGSGGGSTINIHASRLIRLYGDPVPSRYRSQYNYWGAPVIESAFNEWQQEAMAREGGSEALYEVGGKKFSLANMAELITNPTGREQLDSIMIAQQAAFSTLRAWLVGPGVDVEPIGASMSGWDTAYDRIAQALAAHFDMPITKLYGQAPGGLSTDDASATRNWSKRVDTYQKKTLTPALRRLLDVMLAASDGPTSGVVPEIIEVAWSPYEVPSSLEQANETKTRVDALAVAVDKGAISSDEMRSSLEGVQGIRLDDSLAPPAAIVEPVAIDPVDDDVAGIEAEVIGAEDEPLAATAMNGAQVAALLEVIQAVKDGAVEPAQGRAVLELAFNLTSEAARRMISDATPPAPAPIPTPTRVDGDDGPTTSAMIAVYPPAAWAEELAGTSAVMERAEKLHMTLAYLPEFPESRIGELGEVMREVFADSSLAPIEIGINGAAIFTNNDQCHVLLMAGMGLARLRTMLCDALDRRGLLGEQNHDFMPHITLGYYETVPAAAYAESLNLDMPTWSFDEAVVVSGDEHLDSARLDM